MVLGFLPRKGSRLVRNSARGLRRGEDFLELQSCRPYTVCNYRGKGNRIPNYGMGA